jgi:hypothetical protein
MDKSIKTYTILHDLNTKGNWINGEIVSGPLTDKGDIGNIIRTGFSAMTESEKRHLLMKWMPIEKINKELLLLELTHYKNVPIDKMSLNDFTEHVNKILLRYTRKAGGHFLEDDWVIHGETSTIYEVDEDEIIFVNSINKMDVYSKDTSKFIDLLIKQLRQLSPSIKVDHKIDCEDGVYFILIRAQKR